MRERRQSTFRLTTAQARALRRFTSKPISLRMAGGVSTATAKALVDRKLAAYGPAWHCTPAGLAYLSGYERGMFDMARSSLKATSARRRP